MGVTIVSSELSEEEVQRIQQVADALVKEHNYTTHALMHHIGYTEKLSVSLCFDNDMITMDLKKIPS